jgi:myo-inositol-1(or 4)-monophosphatase
LGEECGLDGEGGEWTWVVDPLDGTFNYVTAFPGTASSIALMRAKETRVGVIADFELDSVFACRRGGGMTCDRESLPTCPGPASELGRARLLIDPGHQVPDPTTFGAIQAFADLAPLVPRLVGSSAVSLAAVALTGGCFVGAGLELWDAVAGVLLAEERGRTVRWWSFAGDSRHHVLAGEPDLVDAFEPAMSGFIRAWCGKSAMFSANRGLNQLLGPSPTILV